MKIAFVVQGFPHLSETFILNQITGLLDRGHAVDIFAFVRVAAPVLHPDIEAYQLLRRARYVTVPKDKWARVRSGLGLLRAKLGRYPGVILRALDVLTFRIDALSLTLLHQVAPFLDGYDIIHCQYGTVGNRLAALKKLGLPGKLVTTFHGWDLRMGLAQGGGLYRDLFAAGDRFLSISRFSRATLLQLGLAEDKIVDHPVGIDLRRFPFKWAAGAQAETRRDAIRLITVARLVPEKGLPHAVQALQRLGQRLPGLKLEYALVGDGPQREELAGLIRASGLEGVAQLLGPRDQAGVAAEMLRSDIFLLPSVAEVLPVSLMEAQAAGLPVVATRVGAADEVLSEAATEFLAPPGDPEALADRLARLIARQERWPEFGQAGRRHVAARFDVNVLNDRLVALYQDLLAEPGRAGRGRG